MENYGKGKLKKRMIWFVELGNTRNEIEALMWELRISIHS